MNLPEKNSLETLKVRFPLQKTLSFLPKYLRRIKVAQTIGRLFNSRYHVVEFNGKRLIGNIRDNCVTNALVKKTCTDYGYFGLIKQLLLPGEVHLDVGANYGFHTFGILDEDPAASRRYILVEANPDCAACLCSSARLYPNHKIEVYHCAAGAAHGAARLFYDASDTGCGRLSSEVQPGETSAEIQIVPLDDLLEQVNVARVGLMKIDIEGFELNALRGLSRYLSGQRIRLIYFEVNPACLAAQGVKLSMLFSEFLGHGYRLFWPGDNLDWIQQTYHHKVPAAALRRVTLDGNSPRTLVEFDIKECRDDDFGQCDLLAVSPECRITPL